jgi:hypothetical protein
MAIYIPSFVETPLQSPTEALTSNPLNEDVSHVSGTGDATTHWLAPYIRKRPISLLDDIPRDQCTTAPLLKL